MALHRISWVRGGEAFEVSPKSVTPAGSARAVRQRAAVFKEHVKDTASMAPAAVRSVMVDAAAESYVAWATTLIHDVLCQVDSEVRKLTPTQVLERLSAEEWAGLAESLTPKPSPPNEEESGLDPLTPAQP